jgi:hypothetical protein
MSSLSVGVLSGLVFGVVAALSMLPIPRQTSCPVRSVPQSSCDRGGYRRCADCLAWVGGKAHVRVGGVLIGLAVSHWGIARIAA